MTDTIKFYKTSDPYGFLNNFKKAPMTVFGHEWKNVETPYQAAKCARDEDYKKFLDPTIVNTPRQARDLGQLVEIVPHWDLIKVTVMHTCVLAKFTQNEDLKIKLLETGDALLVEASPVDAFWGEGPNEDGQNMLGKVLMTVRRELRDGKGTI